MDSGCEQSATHWSDCELQLRGFMRARPFKILAVHQDGKISAVRVFEFIRMFVVNNGRANMTCRARLIDAITLVLYIGPDCASAADDKRLARAVSRYLSIPVKTVG